MFQFLKSRSENQFKARSPERDSATDKARIMAILDSIKDALNEATAEHTGLKARIDDVLARAAVTVGNDSDEYLTREHQDTQYQNMLGLETAKGQHRLAELEASIGHYRFLKAALLSRFPDATSPSNDKTKPAAK
jgi:hypothetical protein